MVNGILMLLPILAALGIAMKTRSSLAFSETDGHAISALALVAVFQAATCRHMAFDHLLFAPVALAAVTVLSHGRGALTGAVAGAWAGLAFTAVGALAYPPSVDAFSVYSGAIVPLTLAAVGAVAGSRSLEAGAFGAPLIWLAIPMVTHPDLLRLPGTYVVPMLGVAFAAALFVWRSTIPSPVGNNPP